MQDGLLDCPHYGSPGHGYQFGAPECELCEVADGCRELTFGPAAISFIKDPAKLPQYLTSRMATVRELAEKRLEELTK